MKKTLLFFAAFSLLFLVATQHLRRATAATPPSLAAKVQPSVVPPAENQAEIQFDTLKIDLGTFSEKDGEQKCSFAFTNVGTAPLVIHQAFASCGCTVPTYTKDPVAPGEKGQIDVTYNGKGKFPGHFTKIITVRSNAKTELVRLNIEGVMTK